MIAEYLNVYIESTEETLYKNVFRLPPANYLIVDKDRIYKNKYWDIKPSAIIQYKTDAEYSEHFFSIFKSSVLNCMRSNNNVGLYLSGGLDSSSVLGLVQSHSLEKQFNGPEIEIFSLIFPGMQCDESNYINDVANMWVKDVHEITPELSDYSWRTEDIRNHMDFPDYPNGSMMKPLMKLAGDMDIRVMLTGLGGDEWFTGKNTYLVDILAKMDIELLQKELKYLYSNYDFRTMFNTVLNHMIRPLIPHHIKQITRASLNKLKGKQNFAEWINEEFAEKVDLKDRLKSDTKDKRFKIASQKQLYNTLHNSSRINNLEAEERLSSSFGLEERHPFYNKALIEFSFSLPEQQRIQKFLTKHILRSSMKDFLPVSVVNRVDKTHFNDIVYKALASDDVIETLQNLKIASIGWVDKDIVINNYNMMVKLYNRKDYSYYKYIFPLCSVYGMELWYRTIL
jgi:asparagine synthase (glutamine-hydrolysing)